MANTSKYTEDIRKQMKRDQRTPAYRDLQKRSAEERTLLETKLRERNETIKQLAAKLGLTPEQVAKLAA